MTPTVACLLVALFMGAGMVVAYTLGSSGADPFCSECGHCRAIALERERRQHKPRATKDGPTAIQRLAGAVSTAASKRPRRRSPRRRLPLGGLRKILVGYDGTSAARRALELAVDLAATLQANLTVVSVVPHRPGEPFEPWDDEEEHARQLLEAKQIAAGHGIDVELLEPIGEPAVEIAHVADEGNFDAVLIGSSWSPRWIRLLQGSVARSLAAHCHKTVITVR